MPTKSNHWIILSNPNEYNINQIKNFVNWDVGLCKQSNYLLSQMKQRDRVLFLSTGTIWSIVGECTVYKNPFLDPRQDDERSKYYCSDEKQYYNVLLKLATIFPKKLKWDHIISSKDSNLDGIPHISLHQSVYSITECHYRKIKMLLNECKNPKDRHSTDAVVEELSTPIIEESDIKNKIPIGKGQYGQVYKAHYKFYQAAVKVLNVKPSDLDENELQNVLFEVDVLKHTHCPHIVKFFGACITNDSISIVTEYLPRGELGTILRNKNIHLSFLIRLRMARDIAVGMNWLHSSRPVQFLHRDLKPSNLLVDDNYRIKICDLGLCETKDPQLDKLQSNRFIGTFKYSAPELMQNKQFSEKIDVYSFGLILWEIFTREPVFSQFKDGDGAMLQDFILSGNRPPISKDCPNSLKILMEKCWDVNEDIRPSFDKIVIELYNIMLETAIEDPLGREFWKSLEFDGTFEIDWNIFKYKLTERLHTPYSNQFSELPEFPTPEEFANASDHQLNAYSAKSITQTKLATIEVLRRYKCEDLFTEQPDLDLHLKCLHTLLDIDRNRGKVLLENWGNILRWFGPLIDSNGYPGFLNRITRTLKLKCFHGQLLQDTADFKLQDSKHGSYLVRFSSKPGYYSFSYKASDNSIKHVRILYSPGKNERFSLANYPEQSYYSLESLIYALKKGNIIKESVNCTDYDKLFFKTSSSNYDYIKSLDLFLQE